MKLLLVAFVFEMFGKFSHVDYYDINTIQEAKQIVTEKYHNQPAGFIFNGEPPSTITKLYKIEVVNKQRFVIDITDKLSD